MDPQFDFLSFRKQQEAINEKTLAETGHKETAEAARVLSKKSSGRPKAPADRKPAKKRKVDALAAAYDGDSSSTAGDGPVRRSSRRQPTRAVNSQTEEERLEIEAKNAEETKLAREEERRLKHADRPVLANEGGTNHALGQEDLDAEFERLTMFDPSEHEAEMKRWKKGTKPPLGTKKLQTYAEDLELRSIVKIIPERIYSMAVHPGRTRDLVFAGDKSGHMALWDCTNAGQRKPPAAQKLKSPVGEDGDEAEDAAAEEEERDHGRWWNWQAHKSNSVSWLKFRPGQMDAIYSSGYDGTMRVTHFERGISEEVIDGDQLIGNDDALIHSFDFDPTGNELWASDNDGGLIWRDLRQSMRHTKRWYIDRYKVGCVSINQANPDLAATAHLKRYMALWDLKALKGMSTDASTDDIINASQILHYDHEKACSSAYFDPTGTRLATTSYDDSVRIWDVEPKNLNALKKTNQKSGFEPVERIAHNCQVGRYVTVLRAHWSTIPTLPPHLHIGSMDRSVDLISPDGTSVANLYDADHITAVPAVTASHPTREKRHYGGSASGKVSFFTTPLEEEEA